MWGVNYLKKKKRIKKEKKKSLIAKGGLNFSSQEEIQSKTIMQKLVEKNMTVVKKKIGFKNLV